MAKSVEEVVIKASVEGASSIDQLNDKLASIEKNTKSTDTAMKQVQGGVRNTAYQIQDLAVQLAGGTNAFVALGQQLPQLLSGFGTFGIVAGAVAAVAIPLLQSGLKALGVDFRNLDTKTHDLTESVKKYKEAQQENLPTLAGLGNSYGALTGEAKQFFEIQERLFKTRSLYEFGTTLDEIKSKFGGISDAAVAAERAKGGPDFGATGNLYAYSAALDVLMAKFRGLDISQARDLGNALNKLDPKNPAKNAEILDDVVKKLQDSGLEGKSFKRVMDEVITPIMNVNRQILEMNRNIKESGEYASRLNTEMLTIASDYQPSINSARRGFDQVKAYRLEGELKIAEFRKQMDEKTAKDGVDRAKEIAAFELRTNQDVADKVKDVAKAQQETYRAAWITNDAKIRQLQLEDSIVKLKEKGVFDAEYNLQYEEAVLRSAKEYSDVITSLSEQRRKSIITAEQELSLRREAFDIMTKQNNNAAEQRNSAVRILMLKQEMEISKQAIEDQIARAGKLGDVLRSVNQKVFDTQTGIKPEDLVGKNTLEKQLLEIAQSNKRAAQEAARSFAESFNGQDMTLEKTLELKKGLDDIAEAYKKLNTVQSDNATKSYEATRTWSAGWKDAFTKYKEDAFNAADEAKTYFDTFTKGFEDAMVNFVQTGKLSFKDLANNMIAEFTRVQSRKLLAGLMGDGASSSTGLLDSMWGGVKKIFGFAEGGMPPVGVPSLVGERGPELFIPRTAGTIIPNNQLGSLGGTVNQVTNVNYSIQAVDAASFRQMLARDPEFLYAVTEKGRSAIPSGRR
jgi:lambda family phage tail tape measure protein